MRYFAGAVIAALFVATGLRAQESMPMGRVALRLPGMPLHDPFILAHKPSGTYYLYTSNNPRMTGVRGTGTMAYTSKDLLQWTPPKPVFIVPDDAFATQGGWAPEVHEYKGKYYLFVTLHNEEKVLATPPETWKTNYVRGTIVAVADSPAGPFEMLNKDAAVPPADFMTLDGSLFIDEAQQPWMVYAHEWLQKVDGTIEAVPLKDDLSAVSGSPIHLFKASDAPWLNAAIKPDTGVQHYVTDGPQLYRTNDGHLLMLWSSYESGSYVQTVARSKSGTLKGPWEQLAPLVKADSGHGMLFRTFDGTLMMVLHRPFRNARGKLYEMKDCGDHLEVVRECLELDGDAKEVFEGKE
ncbi:MAG: family 43 glycosylhydrolase [Pontiellaceae bacterium]|nr:family 43 glycosylhydrolase [Pontiellaceae bacterium]MBN2783427.1 family 43 glycosylhydrolase [Pontiellaceae bacterium]